MSSLTGENFIGAERRSAPTTFLGVNPTTNESLLPAFAEASNADAELACAKAAEAFPVFCKISPEVRAAFLEAIADNILQLGDALLERAHKETGLPIARLTGERGRTMGQLRMFANEIIDGAWMDVRIDPAMPMREPAPRPDLRSRKVALGPVVVFGASNFPLAFSVAGGDTAAAFAAGCPVIVKGHPAHPGVCELIAGAIFDAVKSSGLPEGVFSMLNGSSHQLGATLVTNAHIKAVGFTGSRSGGLALTKLAASRPEPIPVYAEMSAVNPVILMQGALEKDAGALARAFTASLTLGAGQFCTNPGMVFAIASDGLDEFIRVAALEVEASQAQTMLTPNIWNTYNDGVARLQQETGVTLLAQGKASSSASSCRPALFTTSAEQMLASPTIAREIFGASACVITCKDMTQLLALLQQMEGQLTVTVHFEQTDEDALRTLLPILEQKVGRLIANGWPTGVEVCHAMVHGGPFPSTSDGRSTSVGTAAIDRFLRPVCYQDFPDALLPDAVRNINEQASIKRVDGKWVLR